ncbi:MAG: riboflavin biosynthesis protein RibF [Oscillospiraceae bacterium]|nr:riboflavin biosynthesis protein RibF [Oscillospiraceae bacterium]
MMKILDPQMPAGCETCVSVGYFDGVHLGHRAVIGTAVRCAKRHGRTSAVLTFDMRAARAGKKGAADLLPMDDRIRQIEDLGVGLLAVLDFASIRGMSGEQFVDEILVRQLSAKAVFCGHDFRFARGGSCGVDELRALCAPRGIRVRVVRDVSDINGAVSTTRIKSLVQEGRMDAAAALLGRRYGFLLPVLRGKGLAHRLGFPTINQRFPEGIVLPRFGVYRTHIELDGRTYAGVTNVGVRPTVAHADGGVFIETFIIGFDGDLYGRDVFVGFGDFMRDERKFDGEDALRRQVEADIAAAQGK